MNAHPLFTRFGVELEYMIVDADTLDVSPVADELLRSEGGSYDEDVKRGSVEWSNELALHVIELKTARPTPRLPGLDRKFHKDIRHINRRLARRGCQLLPGGMHPWMKPSQEGRLWPHAYQDVYAAFHRIFNCRRHGWMNLQSTHLNLPFANDREFARLHGAIRLLLPLIPAIGASSPFINGRVAENLDQRLEVYRLNCKRIPSVTGRVIPEPVRTRRAYERTILNRIYRDMAVVDPEGVLRDEWVNARGAIARFSRNTVEIRLIDMQECPAVDMAIVECLVAVLKRLIAQRRLDAHLSIPTDHLHSILRRTIRNGGAATVAHPAYLRCLGIRTRQRMTVRELWSTLLDQCSPGGTKWSRVIRLLLEEGTLAERLRQAAGKRPDRRRLRSVYRRLGDCLNENERFHA
jgi:gamma-glutamyl:cysteine ligase YbdK (ATP-grasp superfamily)